jgi:ABC-2 type transport system permease protein
MSVFSEVAPFVIAGLVLVLAVTRRARSGRLPWRPRAGGSLAPLPGTEPPVMRLVPLPGDVGLVAGRELRTRVRSRIFRTGTLLVLIVVSAAVVVPTLLGSKASIQRVGFTGPLTTQARAAVIADGAAAGTSVTLVTEPSGQAADADLRAGRIDLALIGGRQVVEDKAPASGTSTTSELAQAIARTAGTGEALAAAGLTPAQAAAVAAARPLPVSSLQPSGPGTAQRATSLAGLVLVFIMLTQYNVWTLTGVVEEKSSRIVEVLLAAIPAAKLLTGKVLGIGLAAFMQAGLAAVVAVTEVRATHSGALHGFTPTAVAASLSWLILGYAFYSWAYAAAGATADRQDQVQALAFPLGLPVIASYVVAATAVTSGNASELLRVLAYLPPTAPLAMPALVSLGAVSWWQFALSAAVSVACTVGVARAAIAVYRASILRAGRVPLRDLLAR